MHDLIKLAILVKKKGAFSGCSRFASVSLCQLLPKTWPRDLLTMGIFCWPIINELGPATFLNLIFCWAQHQCVAPNQCFSYLKTSHPYCLWSDTHVLWFETKTFLSNTNKCQVFILLCTRTRDSFDPIPGALCLLLQQFSFAMDLFAVTHTSGQSQNNTYTFTAISYCIMHIYSDSRT